MKKLSLTFIYRDYQIEGIIIFLFILGLHNALFLFFSLMFFIMFYKRVQIIFVLICLFILSFLIFNLKNQKSITYIDDKVVIEYIKKYEYNDLLTVKYKQKKYHVKLQNHSYNEGDIISIVGDVHLYRKPTIPYSFNQYYFYLSKNVYGYILLKEHSYHQHENTIYKPLNHLINHIDQYQSKDYLNSFLFGEISFKDQELKTYQDLNIMFIFTVSGMHIYSLIFILKKVLFNLSIPKKNQDIIILILYIFILYLNRFSFGILRLFLFFLFYLMSQYFDFRIEKIDKINLIFLIILITNINLFYSLSFLMTYLIIIFLNLMEFRYSSLSFYNKRLYISTLIQFILLPFYSKLSVIMIFLLPLVIYIIAGPIYMLSLLVLFIPEFDSLFMVVIRFFNEFLFYINGKNFVINFPGLDIYLLALYFVFYVYLLQFKSIDNFIIRFLLLISLFIIPLATRPYHERITFLDVSLGDSTIIESNGCVIIVDAYQNVLSYIRKMGIQKVDYLILTHSDQDHIKEAKSIIENIKVNHLVLSYYDENYPIYQANILFLKHGDEIKCNQLKLNIIGPLKKYTNDNDNSLVIQFVFDKKTFLLTGDIENDAESDLADYYKHKLKSDVLKVSHHGSNTSSTKKFLDYVNPSVAIISTGYLNRYDFPSINVLNRIMTYNVMIYRTDFHGSVVYDMRKKNSKWKFYIPF